MRQADNQYGFAEQELMLRTADRYFGVLSANDSLQFAEAEKAAIGRQLDQAKQRFEVGLIAITDIHEAQARYDLTVAQEIEARNQVANAMEALREVTGTGYEALTPLADDSLPLAAAGHCRRRDLGQAGSGDESPGCGSRRGSDRGPQGNRASARQALPDSGRDRHVHGFAATTAVARAPATTARTPSTACR